MDSKIVSALGDVLSSFHCSVGGREYDGWRAPADGDDRERITEASHALRSSDVRVFLGDGFAYAIPGLPALGVIELMKVGAHNDGAKWSDVAKVLSEVGVPFDVVFADEAGLEAVFLSPIDRARASMLAHAVLENEWMDSIAMMAEGEEDDSDGDDIDSDPLSEVVDFIIRTNGLSLWWD